MILSSCCSVRTAELWLLQWTYVGVILDAKFLLSCLCLDPSPSFMSTLSACLSAHQSNIWPSVSRPTLLCLSLVLTLTVLQKCVCSCQEVSPPSGWIKWLRVKELLIRKLELHFLNWLAFSLLLFSVLKSADKNHFPLYFLFFCNKC